MDGLMYGWMGGWKDRWMGEWMVDEEMYTSERFIYKLF